jgi:hypothetical protein
MTRLRTLDSRVRRSSPNGCEMLDAYLSGMTFREIGVVFEIAAMTARSIILNAALIRLMQHSGVEHVEETLLSEPPLCSDSDPCRVA